MKQRYKWFTMPAALLAVAAVPILSPAAAQGDATSTAEQRVEAITFVNREFRRIEQLPSPTCDGVTVELVNLMTWYRDRRDLFPPALVEGWEERVGRISRASCEREAQAADDELFESVVRGFGRLELYKDLGISNGGLGGKRDVTAYGGGIGLTIPARRAGFAFLFGGVTGDASGPAAPTGVDSVDRTFVQFDGQTQFVPAGLDVTQARVTSRYRAFGADLDFGRLRDFIPITLPRSPPSEAITADDIGRFRDAPRTAVSPSASIGISLIEHDERLRVDYGGINFFIDDQREVDTTRLNAGVALAVDHAIEALWLHLAARAKANLDIVDGEGSYHTGQTGNFDETVIADLSRTAITFSFGAEVGAGVEIAEGVTIFATGSAGRIPIWSIVPREGEQARLKSNMHWSFGGSIGVAAGF